MQGLLTALGRGFKKWIGWKRLGIAASLLIISFAITTLVRTLKGVDAGVILVAAAIAIPNLLRARMAANEASAATSIRTVNTAQVTYSSSYPQRGFAHDLATLGPDPRGLTTSSAEHASFIDSTLGNASCTAGAWCTKSGYQFIINTVCKKQTCKEYVVVGTPAGNNTGTRSFCSTSDGVVRYRVGAPLTSAVSVAPSPSAASGPSRSNVARRIRPTTS